jgi:hypothetical protein
MRQWLGWQQAFVYSYQHRPLPLTLVLSSAHEGAIDLCPLACRRFQPGDLIRYITGDVGREVVLLGRHELYLEAV